MPYYNVVPPESNNSGLGALLTELASKPDCGLRVDADGVIDRVDIEAEDADLYNYIFGPSAPRSHLEPTEEEL